MKVEEVPDVVISGITCSSLGVVFLADSRRSQVYRLYITDGTCFTFGKEILSNINIHISVDLSNIFI